VNVDYQRQFFLAHFRTALWAASEALIIIGFEEKIVLWKKRSELW
jgi:hypothetical protein